MYAAGRLELAHFSVRPWLVHQSRCHCGASSLDLNCSTGARYKESQKAVMEWPKTTNCSQDSITRKTTSQNASWKVLVTTSSERPSSHSRTPCPRTTRAFYS